MTNYPPPRCGSWLSRFTLASLVCSILLSTGVSAQQQGEFPREAFVFHVYVDPIYGDDFLAQNQNPLHPRPLSGNPPSTNRPLDPHVDADTPEGGKPGKLQHAPYSFKTVGGAIRWITDFAVTELDFKNAAPPWPAQGNDKVEHIIIHCLPGIYGQTSGVESGIPGNGEQFPIRIPHDVSIQGTSAMDTVFYGGSTPSHIFEINPSGTGLPRPQFIDSVTITKAAAHPAVELSGAGIVIWGESGGSPIISNCFIHHNAVGIAVLNCFHTQSGPTAWIVNNTLADNDIGIYSGGFLGGFGALAIADDGKGESELLVINNVLVPKSGGSAFEGVSFFDMTVILADQSQVNPNAFSPSQANIGLTFASFKSTTPRDPTNGISIPRVDISLYTDSDGGNLFIQDILRNSPAPTNSDHDYRLAPMVSTSNSQMPEAGQLNPLVNQGVHTGFTPANNTNQFFVFGLINLFGFFFADKTEFTALDFDAEGYGNPRVASRENFPGGVEIDLGADEMAPLIVAGYAGNTRIFSRPDASSGLGPPEDHSKIYFFDVFTQGNSYERPDVNSLISPSLRPFDTQLGLDNRWYFQITASQNPFFAGPYTNGVGADQTDPVLNQGRRTFRFESRCTVVSSFFYGPLGNPSTGGTPVGWMNPLAFENYGEMFMRNLQCDFSPHLLPDRHGVWPDLFTTGPEAAGQAPPAGQAGWGKDIYASNPWYRGALVGRDRPDLSVTYDNPFLFYLHPDEADVDETPNAITASTLNSPGTSADFPRAGYEWLWSFNATFPWAFKGASTYSVNQWGYGGDSGVPGNNYDDTLIIAGIGIDWHGIRFNMERKQSIIGTPETSSNVQTFLQVDGIDSAMAGSSLQSGALSAGRQAELQRMMMEPDRAAIEKELKRFLKKEVNAR